MNKRAWSTLGTCALVALAASYGCGSGGGGNDLSDGGASDATQDTGGQSDDGGSSDATSGDAASDAPSDASTWDGNTSCGGTNTPCQYTNDAGAAQNGVCQATNMCGLCTMDTQCSGYGNGYICVGGACVVGDCHANTDCATNDAGAVVCVNHRCTACDGITGGNYYVDPVDGSDGADSTGSNMAGGQAVSVCAFKTITHALKVIGAPSSATTITVLNDDAAGETWPITVPANVVIKGQSSSITVNVTGTPGFVLGGANSGLESLVVNGGSIGTGVNAGAGSTTTTYLKNVTVSGFGDAVLVNGASSVLTLDEGVTLTKSSNGLHVTDSATVDCAVTNQANPVSFTGNSQYGILVDKTGAVSFTGTAGTLGAGSIVASGNTIAGAAFIPNADSPGVPNSLVTGFVAWNNLGGPGDSSGLLLEGGAHLKVRNSYFGENYSAVTVTANVQNNGGSTDTSGIDLGGPFDNGMNTLQSPTAAHNGTGICVQFLPNQSQDLYAIGNLWADSIGKTSLDCSTTQQQPLSVVTSCGGSLSDLGGPGFLGSSKLRMYVAQCTCSNVGFTCQ